MAKATRNSNSMELRALKRPLTIGFNGSPVLKHGANDFFTSLLYFRQFFVSKWERRFKRGQTFLNVKRGYCGCRAQTDNPELQAGHCPMSQSVPTGTSKPHQPGVMALKLSCAMEASSCAAATSRRQAQPELRAHLEFAPCSSSQRGFWASSARTRW